MDDHAKDHPPIMVGLYVTIGTIGSQMCVNSHFWAGWIAAPPHDWSSIPPILASLPVPADGFVCDDDPLFSVPTNGGISLASEPMVASPLLHGGVASMMTICAHVPIPVPPVWDDEWHERVWESMASSIRHVSLGLPAAGFRHVLPLGVVRDNMGPDYWANRLLAMTPAWMARIESDLISGHMPATPAPGDTPHKRL